MNLEQRLERIERRIRDMERVKAMGWVSLSPEQQEQIKEYIAEEYYGRVTGRYQRLPRHLIESIFAVFTETADTYPRGESSGVEFIRRFEAEVTKRVKDLLKSVDMN